VRNVADYRIVTLAAAARTHIKRGAYKPYLDSDYITAGTPVFMAQRKIRRLMFEKWVGIGNATVNLTDAEQIIKGHALGKVTNNGAHVLAEFTLNKNWKPGQPVLEGVSYDT
jgi:hypothetical protein